jgi:hypothetical protein
MNNMWLFTAKQKVPYQKKPMYLQTVLSARATTQPSLIACSLASTGKKITRTIRTIC